MDADKIQENRDNFLLALRRVIQKTVEAHPEKFSAAFSPESLKRDAEKAQVSEEVWLSEVRVPKISQNYTSLLALRQCFFLDEILVETCLHVGIEPSLEVLLEHIGAMSEEEANFEFAKMTSAMDEIRANLKSALIKSALHTGKVSSVTASLPKTVYK